MKLNKTNKKLALFSTTIMIISVFTGFIMPVRAEEPLITKDSPVAAGHRHSLAIRDDGTLWAWGANRDGQLGDGTRIGRLESVQVLNLVVPALERVDADHVVAPLVDPVAGREPEPEPEIG